MLIEVKVPVLPESIAEATLVAWHKKAGEAVKRDENLIDVETDKVVLELPAPDSGVIIEIRRPDGSTVKAQEIIAVIDTGAKAAASVAPAQVAAPAPATAAASAPPAPVAPTMAPAALPAARKIMADQGVDAADVTGTGRGGRLTKGDVQAVVEARADVPKAPSAPAPAPPPMAKAPPVSLPADLGGRPEQRVPMS